MKSAGIGVAHRVEPVHGLLFGVAGRRQQAVHDFLISDRRSIFDERIHFLRRGRQPRHIQRHSADERAPVGLRRRLEPFARQARAEKRVNRIGRSQFGNRRPLHWLIGPVSFVFRALGHPAADGIFLRRIQFLVGELRRHDPGVFGEDPLDDLAVIWIAGDDRDHVGLSGFERFVADVEPQSRHARVLVRAVAAETGVRHDRTNVAVEADSALAGFGRGEPGN